MIALDDTPPAAQPALAQIRHLLGSHLRHIAGRPRPTVDLMHLHEIVDRLDALARRVASVPALKDALAARLGLLRPEVEACTEARLAPLSHAQRADVLAARTNQQFLLYRRLFAGRTRLTRRPELLQRIFINLQMILHEMGHVDSAQLPAPGDHRANIELVTRELERLTEEGSHIVTERKHATRDELIRQLGADVNAELVEYRRAVEHKDRELVDLEVLAGICDRLGDLAHQMLGLADRTKDTVHLANLRLASRSLAIYEYEYLQVSEAKHHHISLARIVTSEPVLRSQLMVADVSEDDRQLAIARLQALLADPVVRKIAAGPFSVA
jgi:hypothetical protein